jgi:hypothetical protein
VTSRQIFRGRVYAMTSPFPSYTPHVPAKPKTLSRQKLWKTKRYIHNQLKSPSLLTDRNETSIDCGACVERSSYVASVSPSNVSPGPDEWYFLLEVKWLSLLINLNQTHIVCSARMGSSRFKFQENPSNGSRHTTDKVLCSLSKVLLITDQSQLH